MEQRNLNLYALLRPNPSTQEVSWIVITKLYYCLAGKQVCAISPQWGKVWSYLFFSSYRAKYRPYILCYYFWPTPSEIFISVLITFWLTISPTCPFLLSQLKHYPKIHKKKNQLNRVNSEGIPPLQWKQQSWALRQFCNNFVTQTKAFEGFYFFLYFFIYSFCYGFLEWCIQQSIVQYIPNSQASLVGTYYACPSHFLAASVLWLILSWASTLMAFKLPIHGC